MMERLHLYIETAPCLKWVDLFLISWHCNDMAFWLVSLYFGGFFVFFFFFTKEEQAALLADDGNWELWSLFIKGLQVFIVHYSSSACQWHCYGIQFFWFVQKRLLTPLCKQPSNWKNTCNVWKKWSWVKVILKCLLIFFYISH